MQDIVKFFINPLLPAFLFLFILLLKKQPGRRHIVLLCLYLYAVSIPLGTKLVAGSWALDDTFNPDKTYDAVIVLTGMADASWYLQRKNDVFPLNCYYRFGNNVERIITAAELLQGGHAQKIFFGDLREQGFSEADLVVDFLEKQGIAPEQVVVYGEICNTYDEAVKFNQCVIKEGLQRFLLVTSQMHMRRAAAAFNKQNLYPDILSVSKGSETIGWHDFIPGKNGLSATQKLLYEIVGYVGYFITGKL